MAVSFNKNMAWA